MLTLFGTQIDVSSQDALSTKQWQRCHRENDEQSTSTIKRRTAKKARVADSKKMPQSIMQSADGRRGGW